jgi:steroid 5-alpha reductase family enzyme
MFNIYEMLGASFILVMGLMGVLWIVYILFRNAGIADIGWALAFVVTAWVYFSLGIGADVKKWVITLMVTIWGLRLAWQLFERFVRLEEDPRYQQIRQIWGTQYENFKMLLMFMLQGVIAIILSVPFLIVCSKGVATWHGVETAGIIVWALGLLGESWADYQLYQFKVNPDNKDKVLREGLWRFSRHPNYFFEFIVWIGYFLFALGTPGGWIAIISPILVLCLLTRVSGIPISEAQSLKTKGEDYAEYQRTTSSFVPWFPKK